MGFEAALAIVIREDGKLHDYRKDPDIQDDGGGLLSDLVKVPITAPVWRVFKFIDFGRVRTLVKENSSLSVEQRDAGTFDHRAAKCTASFLLAKFFACESQVKEKKNYEYAVPFIIDHYLYARRLNSGAMERHSFAEALLCSYGREFVSGIYALDNRRRSPTHEEIFQGALWEHNRRLMEETVVSATTMDGHFFESPCGLVWAPAKEARGWLKQLLIGDSAESVELRKDPLAVALVRSWFVEMALFARHNAKIIMLTGSFHLNAHLAIRSQSMYL